MSRKIGHTEKSNTFKEKEPSIGVVSLQLNIYMR